MNHSKEVAAFQHYLTNEHESQRISTNLNESQRISTNLNESNSCLFVSIRVIRGKNTPALDFEFVAKVHL